MCALRNSIIFRFKTSNNDWTVDASSRLEGSLIFLSGRLLYNCSFLADDVS